MSGRGAERILQVIEWMAGEVRPVGFAEVVAALSLPKSSTLDLLRLLVDTGYAERLEDGRYRLRRLPGEPSAERRGWGTLLRHADAPLRRAVARTRESGFIAVLGDDLGIHYIAKVLPRREIYYDRDVTVARRPHQVSSGMILLGRLSHDALRDYAAAECAAGRYTGTEAELIQQVDTARRTGMQVTRVGIVEGAGGMAAPIRDRAGHVIAALNIAGPALRLGEAVAQIEPVLRDTADEISRSLGWEDRAPDDSGEDAA
ncbi:MAG: IclR family transcriptional regulator C-terminal domain-containing protein [Celeribacter sp.]|jgi:DNA-binding IclR family transcriptional regulator